jgi:hypothetical protein
MHFEKIYQLEPSTVVEVQARPRMERPAHQCEERQLVPDLRGKEASNAAGDAEVGRKPWRTMSLRMVYQQPDQTEVALREGARVGSCGRTCKSRTMVSTLRTRGSFVLGDHDGDCDGAKRSLLVGALRQCGVAAGMEVRTGPSMESFAGLDPKRELVSFVRAKSTIGTQDDAATGEEPPGTVPLDPIHKQSASLAMAVQARASMGSPAMQCQGWETQKRDMVPRMLQLPTEVPRQKFNRENAGASSQTRWALPLKRVSQLEV